MRRIGWSSVVLLAFVMASVVPVRGQDEAVDIATIARSVVQIVTLFCDTLPPEDGDETDTPIERGSDVECDDTPYVGSGSIIATNGTILTNDHVVRPWEHDLVPPDTAERAGWYLVLETVDPRQAARPVFFARVDAANADLDLATLVPFYTRDGEPIEPDEVEMVGLPISERESVELGERLHILGYSDVGGDQISYATGVVSGFSADDRVPDLGGEAWIRTDATLLPAGSGGAAADLNGILVGVPTWDPAAADDAAAAQPALLRPIPAALDLFQPTEPIVEPGEADITVTGTIVSADDGDPIEDASFFILNPGISPTRYAEDPTNPEAVFADGESDEDGHFVTAPPVFRNQGYGVVVSAPGYLSRSAENKVFADDDGPELVDLGEIGMPSAQ